MSNEDAGSQQQTLDPLDWSTFRLMSIKPHGFGEERIYLWPKLLHVPENGQDDRGDHKYEPTDASSVWSDILEEPITEADDLVGTPHSDERQIELDTDRSFVLYPVDVLSNRDKLQTALNRLIVTLFRGRPHLHYFQGFHDIVSVIFLTLPRESRLPVIEKLSLHRLRDSMGTNLDPVIGLLRLLQRLLRLADEPYANILARTAPLPYYALSNLLTLFSHDVPSLSLIQHVFDYLLCRPPIAVVYLAAAIVLTRREEVQVLEDEGEEGMVHSLLTVLPDLYEEGEEEEENLKPEVTALSSLERQPSSEDQDEKLPTEQTLEPPEREHMVPHPQANGNTDSKEEEGVNSAASLEPLYSANAAHDAPSPSRSDSSHEHVPEEPSSLALKQPSADPDQTSTLPADKPPLEPSKANPTESDVAIDAEPPDDNNDNAAAAPPSDGPVEEQPARDDESETKAAEPSTRSASPDAPARPHRPRVSLTKLLTDADELYARFPPSHAEIAMASVMGSQSVMQTWSECAADLPDDDEAERMVLRPELVVLPAVEGEDEDETEERRRRGREKEKEERERRRRRLRKPRRLTDMVVQRKTMVAGAVLVLGVAMAVYGLNGGLPGGGGGGGPHHRSGLGKELKKIGKFLGGFVAGARGKVLEGI